MYLFTDIENVASHLGQTVLTKSTEFIDDTANLVAHKFGYNVHLAQTINDVTSHITPNHEGWIRNRVSPHENPEVVRRKILRVFQKGNPEDVHKVVKEIGVKGIVPYFNDIVKVYADTIQKVAQGQNVAPLRLYKMYNNISALSPYVKNPQFQAYVQQINPLVLAKKLPAGKEVSVVDNYVNAVRRAKTLNAISSGSAGVAIGSLIGGIGLDLVSAGIGGDALIARGGLMLGSAILKTVSAGSTITFGTSEAIKDKMEGQSPYTILTDFGLDMVGVRGLTKESSDMIGTILKNQALKRPTDFLDSLARYDKQADPQTLPELKQTQSGILQLIELGKKQPQSKIRRFLNGKNLIATLNIHRKNLGSSILRIVGKHSADRHYLNENVGVLKKLLDEFDKHGLFTGSSENLQEQLIKLYTEPKDTELHRAVRNYVSLNRYNRLLGIVKDARRNGVTSLLVSNKYAEDPTAFELDLSKPVSQLVRELNDYIEEDKNKLGAYVPFYTISAGEKSYGFQPFYIPTGDNFFVHTGSVMYEGQKYDIDYAITPLSTPENWKESVLKRLTELYPETEFDPTKVNFDNIQTHVSKVSIFPYKVLRTEQTINKRLEKLKDLVPKKLKKFQGMQKNAINKFNEKQFKRLSNLKQNVDKLKGLISKFKDWDAPSDRTINLTYAQIKKSFMHAFGMRLKLDTLSFTDKDLDKILKQYMTENENLSALISKSFGTLKDSFTKATWNFQKRGKGFAIKFASPEDQKKYILQQLTRQFYSNTEAPHLLNQLLEFTKTFKDQDPLVNALHSALEDYKGTKENPFQKMTGLIGSMFTMFRPAITISNTAYVLNALHSLIPDLPVLAKPADFAEQLGQDYKRLLTSDSFFKYNALNPLIPVFDTALRSYVLGAFKSLSGDKLERVSKQLATLFGTPDEAEFFKQWLKEDPQSLSNAVVDTINGFNQFTIQPQFIKLINNPIAKSLLPWRNFIVAPFAVSAHLLGSFPEYFRQAPMKFLAKNAGLALLSSYVLGEGSVIPLGVVEAPYHLSAQVASFLMQMFGVDADPQYPENPVSQLAQHMALYFTNPDNVNEFFHEFGTFLLKHVSPTSPSFVYDTAKGLASVLNFMQNLPAYGIVSKTAGSTWLEIPTPVFSLMKKFSDIMTNMGRASTDYAKDQSLDALAETLLPQIRTLEGAVAGHTLVKGIYTEPPEISITPADVGMGAIVGLALKTMDATLNNGEAYKTFNAIKDALDGKVGAHAEYPIDSSVDYFHQLSFKDYTVFNNPDNINAVFDKLALEAPDAYSKTMSRMVQLGLKIGETAYKDYQKGDYDSYKTHRDAFKNFVKIMEQQDRFFRHNKAYQTFEQQLKEALDKLNNLSKLK